MTARMSTHRYGAALSALLLTAALATPSAQTKIPVDKNKYTPAQDVQLGQEASAEVRKELPMLNDNRVDDYVEDVGRRLAAAIPAQYQHREFRYTFDVVNQKEINAFALPGGPMYLNRGMIEAAKSEAEMAGVMAHEISHVALRHGTAQATKGEKFQIGAIAGQVLGAIVGGAAGSVIAQGSQFGLGAYFMKFGREYERQADLLGAQILARAGYDPRQMANMFKTIEAQGGGGGPEWLSDHPNPGNRYDAINREAAMLRVNNPIRDTGEFQSVQARLRGMSPALTAKQIAERQGRNAPVGTSGRTNVQVEPPSGQYRTYNAANFLRVAVPANWQPLGGSNNTVTYAPEGAYFQGNNGGSAFTHGIEIGTAAGSGNLSRDTQQLLQSLSQSNPQLRVGRNSRREDVGGRAGLTTQLSNVSEVTGQPEYIALTTTQLRDGSLLYVIGVAPEREANIYENTFRRVRQNLQIADR
jgi:beta-barrel assembly-enhancing protease